MFTSRLYFFLTDSLNTSTAETHTVAPGSSAADVNELQSRIKELLSKYSSGVRVSKMPQIYREMYWEDLSTEVLCQLENWPHVCTVSIECRFYGRCQYPTDFWVFICQMLFHVCLLFLSYSVAVTEIPHTPTTPLPNCNNAFWNPRKSLFTGLVFWRGKVSLCGVLEQVLGIADLPPLTDHSTDNPNSWWHVISMPSLLFLVWVFSQLLFMLFLVGGFIAS